MFNRAISNVRFTADTVRAFARLAMSNPQVAAETLSSMANALDMLELLRAYPGAIECIYQSASCSRKVKSLIFDERSFAKLAVARPDVAMEALLAFANPDAIVAQLGQFPGALDALYKSDRCTRSLKFSILETLEDVGQMILS